MKIFVIGFNKTGTTSLHSLFTRYKIKSTHNTTPVLQIIDKYEAFTDGSHANFREYYARYPDALFILNTRPIQNWLVSRYKHAEEHRFNACWCWPMSKERTNKWITEREEHYSNVLEFFADKKDQLLIVNIEGRGWENRVLKFIGKTETRAIVSKSNVRRDMRVQYINNIKAHVSQCLKARGYNGNELLLPKTTADKRNK